MIEVAFDLDDRCKQFRIEIELAGRLGNEGAVRIADFPCGWTSLGIRKISPVDADVGINTYAVFIDIGIE